MRDDRGTTGTTDNAAEMGCVTLLDLGGFSECEPLRTFSNVVAQNSEAPWDVEVGRRVKSISAGYRLTLDRWAWALAG